MCIICIKKGTRTPELETVRNCWNNNPDGAGIFWYNPDKPGDEKIGYKKGFFREKDFIAFWKKTSAKYKLCGFHCRIATHGGIKASLTHPFPIDRVQNKELSGYCSRLAIHNGVLQADSYKGYYTTADSDTSAFCKRIFTEQLNYAKIKECTRGSRFVVIERTGGLRLFGCWQYEEGCWYSNDSYSYRKTVSYKVPVSYGKNYYNYWNNYWKTGNAKTETPVKETKKAETGKPEPGNAKTEPGNHKGIEPELKYYGMGYGYEYDGMYD